MPTIKCDACDAVFEADENTPVEKIFCPECGEVEDLFLMESCSCGSCGCAEEEEATAEKSHSHG